MTHSGPGAGAVAVLTTTDNHDDTAIDDDARSRPLRPGNQCERAIHTGPCPAGPNVTVVFTYESPVHAARAPSPSPGGPTQMGATVRNVSMTLHRHQRIGHGWPQR